MKSEKRISNLLTELEKAVREITCQDCGKNILCEVPPFAPGLMICLECLDKWEETIKVLSDPDYMSWNHPTSSEAVKFAQDVMLPEIRAAQEFVL